MTEIKKTLSTTEEQHEMVTGVLKGGRKKVPAFLSNINFVESDTYKCTPEERKKYIEEISEKIKTDTKRNEALEIQARIDANAKGIIYR